MSPSKEVIATPETPVPLLHRAARIEDSFHRFRVRWGRRRGLTATIVPFVGYGSTTWVRVLCRVRLIRADGKTKRTPDNARGWRSFVGIPIGNAIVTVKAGRVTRELVSDRGGVVDVRVDVKLTPGWHEISISVEGSEPVIAPVYIVDPSVKFGLVSDIDDTVMVTALPRPFLAAWNTFVLNEHARRPVPGMAVLYERLKREYPGAPVIYLSTGAWNVAPTLNRFLGRNLYPQGSLLLTDWGPTHDRWFRSGQEHKRTSLRRLASEFPDLAWLLVGDDGQHDPELYRDFAKEFPTNVAGVAIRQLSTSEAVLAGGRNTEGPRSTPGVEWFYAPDGAGIAEQLSDTGILPPDTFPKYKSR